MPEVGSCRLRFSCVVFERFYVVEEAAARRVSSAVVFSAMRVGFVS